jgi:hypothetical protein
MRGVASTALLSGGHGTGVLDAGFALGEFDRDKPVISLEHEHGVGWGMFFNVGEHSGHAIRGDDVVDHTQFKELASELLSLFSGGGHAKRVGY